MGRIPRADPFSLRFSLSVLGEYNAELGSSWAIWAHTRTGGAFHLADTSDDLTGAVMAMLRDVYPLFLLSSGNEPFGLRGAEMPASKGIPDAPVLSPNSPARTTSSVAMV